MREPTCIFRAGMGNAVPEHWQRTWHGRLAGSIWVEHADWQNPDREDWV